MIVEIDEYVGGTKVDTISVAFDEGASLKEMIAITTVCIDLLNWSIQPNIMGDLRITREDRI